MRWRNGLMGLSVIAKLLSRMGLNPMILRQGRAFAFLLSPSVHPALPRRPYRASGLVLGSIAGFQRATIVAAAACVNSSSAALKAATASSSFPAEVFQTGALASNFLANARYSRTHR
jgi:hypothetical protein